MNDFGLTVVVMFIGLILGFLFGLAIGLPNYYEKASLECLEYADNLEKCRDILQDKSYL